MAAAAAAADGARRAGDLGGRAWAWLLPQLDLSPIGEGGERIGESKKDATQRGGRNGRGGLLERWTKTTTMDEQRAIRVPNWRTGPRGAEFGRREPEPRARAPTISEVDCRKLSFFFQFCYIFIDKFSTTNLTDVVV